MEDSRAMAAADGVPGGRGAEVGGVGGECVLWTRPGAREGVGAGGGDGVRRWRWEAGRAEPSSSEGRALWFS